MAMSKTSHSILPILILNFSLTSAAHAEIMFHMPNKAGGAIFLTDNENPKHCGSGPDNPWSVAFGTNRKGKAIALGCWSLNENNAAEIRWFEGLIGIRTYNLEAFDVTPYGGKLMEDAAHKLGL